MEYFEAAGFEVHTPDLPSHGSRQGERPMWRNRVVTYVTDMEAYLETFDRPPILIGHSMGGFVTQHLLARGVPMAGAGLLATIPYYGAIKAAFGTMGSRPGALLRTLLKRHLYPMVEDPKAAAHMFMDHDAGAEEIERLAAHLGDESFLAFLDIVLFNLPGKPKGDVPTCVVGGELDLLFPPPSQHATAKRLGGNCHIVPGAPHNLMMSKHWEVAAKHFLDWASSI